MCLGKRVAGMWVFMGGWWREKEMSPAGDRIYYITEHKVETMMVVVVLISE